ncbi:MAG: hypothetical protein J0L99_04110 [Chitinophagales bacterium]|nr:hypothetical protein [Chitinophagales bacterium]
MNILLKILVTLTDTQWIMIFYIGIHGQMGGFIPKLPLKVTSFMKTLCALKANSDGFQRILNITIARIPGRVEHRASDSKHLQKLKTDTVPKSMSDKAIHITIKYALSAYSGSAFFKVV